MLKNKLYILLLLFVYSINAFATNIDAEKLFEQGNKFYNQQDYKSADSVYNILDTAGYFSTELYYNLGNTNYKLGNIPKTIYNYERALKLSPGNEDIVHNLKIANELLADKNTIQKSKRIDDLIYTSIKAKTNFWANLSIALFILGSISFILFLSVKKSKHKRTSFYFGVALYVFGAITIYLASLQYHKQTTIEYGIIFKPFAELKIEPSTNSSTAFILHEGTKVKVIDQNEEWYEVSFNDGQIAWVKKDALKVF